MFQVIGACFDGSAKFYGSRLGPQAIRLAGMNHIFKNANIPFLDIGDVLIKSQIASDEPLKGLDWGNQFYPALIQKTEKILQNRYSPLIIGGDQSIRFATLTAALNQHDPDELGIIWIDPHIYFKTPDGSDSVHQTVLSYLVQDRPQRDLPFLSYKSLNLDNIAFLGAEYHGGPHTLFNQTADMIIQEGTSTVVKRLFYWIKRQNIKKLWISFNIQSMSKFYSVDETPILGLTIDQALNLAKGLNYLCNTTDIDLIGVETLEINPILDPLNQSSHITLQWLTYLLGGLKREGSLKKKELIRTA